MKLGISFRKALEKAEALKATGGEPRGALHMIVMGPDEKKVDAARKYIRAMGDNELIDAVSHTEISGRAFPEEQLEEIFSNNDGRAVIISAENGMEERQSFVQRIYEALSGNNKVVILTGTPDDIEKLTVSYPQLREKFKIAQAGMPLSAEEMEDERREKALADWHAGKTDFTAATARPIIAPERAVFAKKLKLSD